MSPDYVLGITHHRLAGIASRFGFECMEVTPDEVGETLYERLDNVYQTSTGAGLKGEPLKCMLVTQSVDDFVDKWSTRAQLARQKKQ